jgi:DNA segregation ATPase FtsK/SpoIIIE, S-DNA-T family
MGRRRKNSPLKLKLRPETVHSSIAVVLIALGLLVIVSFSGQGKLLTLLNEFLAVKIGASVLILPFILIAAGLTLFRTKWAWSKPNVLLGTLLIFLGSLGAFKTGEIGANIFKNLSPLITTAGAYIVFGGLLIIGALVVTQFSMAEVLEWLAAIRLRRQAKADAAELADGAKSGFRLPKLSLPFGKKADQPFSINQGVSQEEPTDAPGTAIEPSSDGSENQADRPDSDEVLSGTLLTPNPAHLIWEYPPLSLLSSSEGGEANRGDVNENAAVIETTLDSFGIKARVAEVNYGPSVTQYALEITRGTKLSKITGLTTDLALALAAPTGQIRIEAPIAGRSLVGVEVPNHSAQYVTLRKMLSSSQMKKHPSKLAAALGISVSGLPIIMDISKMPHILIAGATGSGKSVAINTFICSMLFRASPAEVKMILVDPKRVELTGYNDIPHLLVPVIVEPKKVVSALKWATHEMDRRYKQLEEVGVRNIDGYNELAGHAAMPSIVIVIDELADIMLFAPSEVEESITRIAQMARAVGIHLVLATQRPSVDVITGLIKANIPGRIAFNVSSMTDSRVVLDTPGAEKLLGKGDMLFIPPDQAKPMRIQGTFVSDQEIKSLIDFIKSQGQKPEYEEEIVTKYKATGGNGKGAGSMGADGDEKDELFAEVVRYVAQAGKGSSSLIQRKFSVGYNRAARILDQLYTAGIVGPQEGSKPREVNMGRAMEYLRDAGDAGDS